MPRGPAPWEPFDPYEPILLFRYRFPWNVLRDRADFVAQGLGTGVALGFVLAALLLWRLGALAP